MTVRQLTLALLLLQVLLSGMATAQTALLMHNPFSRPPSAEAPEPGSAQSERNEPIQPVDLRATMVASTQRLADVAGRILRPGDEVQGFTLLQVFEDRAVFENQGRHLTVYVKPELAELVRNGD